MFGTSSKAVDIPIGESVPQEEGRPPLRIATIPDDFYGGKNPAIYEPVSKKSVAEAPQKVPLVVEEDTDDVVQPKSKMRIWIILGSISFVLFVGGVTAYYLYDAGILFRPKEDVPTSVPIPEPIPVPEQIPEPIVIPDPVIEPEEDVSIEIPSFDSPILFPPINTSQGPDIDNDGLTDAEELVFGTDPGMWDTDGDGYNDGLEVMNLYNPLGFAPVRIIDSAVVREYTNPTFGYNIYYPQAWNVGAVDTSAREILFSGITGDYIAVYVRPMERGETFQEWFVRNAAGERITDIEGFENRFKIPGFRRTDGLVAYFGIHDIVYTIVYYPVANVPVQYRAIMNMMIQSFRPDDSVESIPEQRVLPGVSDPNDAVSSLEVSMNSTDIPS
jgi:hypothetical protein